MTELTRETQRLVAGVRFHKVGKLYYFNSQDYPDLKVGDEIIAETTRGRQMGQVQSFKPYESVEPREVQQILRLATPRDLVLRQHWEAQQDSVLMAVQMRAKAMGIHGVKFVAAVYNYDGSQLSLLYTADEKPGLGKLTGEISRQYEVPVDMRQIGPRDVAKLLGGYGACGTERCCSTFLTDFSPVSIKMAKAQGISLNPTEITGMCGRLRCCLVYEYEQYVEARSKLPRKNKRVGTPHGEGKVLDVLPMQDAVLVLVEDTRHVVQRADLQPLEELEALAKKAKEPCTKHGDGPCDCGAKPGKSAKNQPSPQADADDE
jgi:cell fate regulator YaaT (PSP1 superfamily)